MTSSSLILRQRRKRQKCHPTQNSTTQTKCNNCDNYMNCSADRTERLRCGSRMINDENETSYEMNTTKSIPSSYVILSCIVLLSLCDSALSLHQQHPFHSTSTRSAAFLSSASSTIRSKTVFNPTSFTTTNVMNNRPFFYSQQRQCTRQQQYISSNSNLLLLNKKSTTLYMLSPRYLNSNDNNNNNESENSNGDTDNNNNEDYITDSSLSNFLREQENNKRNTGVAGNIRDRIKQWFGPSSNDENEYKNLGQPPVKRKENSPPVRPIDVDGSAIFGSDNENNENNVDDLSDESRYLFDEDDDEITRAKKIRAQQKRERLEKIMSNLQQQIENSPADIVKNIERAQIDEKEESFFRVVDSMEEQTKKNQDADALNTLLGFDSSSSESQASSSSQPKVIRPNFDNLLDGMPSFDDMFGDGTLGNSFNASSSSTPGTENQDEIFDSFASDAPSYSALGADPNSTSDYLEALGKNKIDNNSNSNTDDKSSSSSEKQNQNNDSASARERYLQMEQQLRNSAGLTKRQTNQNSDNTSDSQASTADSNQNKNDPAQSLARLEELRRQRYGDSNENINISEDLNRLRNRIDNSENESNQRQVKPPLTPEEELMQQKLVEFQQREMEMRKKVGLTKKPKTSDNDNNKDDINNSLSTENPRELREGLSSAGLAAVEKLRRQKLGTNFSSQDQEQIMNKYQEFVESDEYKFDVADDTNNINSYENNVGMDQEDMMYSSDYDSTDSTIIESDNSDPSFTTIPTNKGQQNQQNTPKKRASIEDQIYRSIAAKSGGDLNDDKRSKWEAFMQKEAEMRQKMGMIETSEGEGNEGMDGSTSGVMLPDDFDNEIPAERLERPKFPTSYQNEIQDQNNGIDFNDYEDDEIDMPESLNNGIGEDPSNDMTSQIYRSIAAASDENKKDEFLAYYEKEKLMREKMGMTFTEEDEDSSLSNTVDMSGIFDDSKRDYVYSFEEQEEDTTITDDGNQPDTPDNENMFVDGTDAFDSDDDWFRKKEQTVEQQNTYDSAPETPPQTPFFGNEDTVSEQQDFFYEETDEISEEGEDEEKDGEQMEDNWMSYRSVSSPKQKKSTPPETPFSQQDSDLSEEEVNEEYDTSHKKDVTVSEAFFRPADYSYDPSELTDLFSKDVFSRDDNDYYLNRGSAGSGSSRFSAFAARKADLLENTEITVEEINGLLDYDPTSRLSMVLKPDSAFGLILRLEGTLVDITEVQMRAWTEVAERYQYRIPDSEEIQLAQVKRPDDAIRNIFFWTTDIFESREIAMTHYDILEDLFQEMVVEHASSDSEILSYSTTEPPRILVTEGVREWLHLVRQTEVPFGVMSHFDKEKLDFILNVTELSPYFGEDKRVSISNGYNREAQEMLGVALRIERRPDHCAVIDSTPSSCVAAHDVEMKSVALMGLYPLYELNTADLTIPYFEDMSIINIRRLFSDTEFDEPMLDLENVIPLDNNNAQVGIRTWAEGDR